MRTLPLFGVFLAAGCPLSKESFPEQAAEEICTYADTCENALYFFAVPDVESCIAELSADYEGGWVLHLRSKQRS